MCFFYLFAKECTDIIIYIYYAMLISILLNIYFISQSYQQQDVFSLHEIEGMESLFGSIEVHTGNPDWFMF